MREEMGNFAFLSAHSPQLAKLGQLAERYFTDDPPTTLVKLRQFSEIVAKEVAARQALLVDNRMSFDDILRVLKSRSILQREVAELFYHLKRSGNIAAHEDKGSSGDALTALKIARAIGIWFYQSYANAPAFRPGPFVPPTPPVDASAALHQEIQRLKQAVTASADAEAKARLATQEAEEARQELEGRAAANDQEKACEAAGFSRKGTLIFGPSDWHHNQASHPGLSEEG
jgi:type I restriction enzyme R subunit